MSAPVYKVMTVDDWAAFDRTGGYAGSALDHDDGFIHLSAPDQVAGTVARHFAGKTGLVAVAIDSALLGKAMKWEAARDGVCFPHAYRDLTRDMVLSAEPIPDDPDARALAMALLAV